ncbi:DUF2254 domain-containing protein [Pseudorhodobacter turbinis]|uniref:DUF2254 domain-containing protein n=1 Tax=Pseudorhodobacter turbinis TaxID=2500533 RepID=A0A4V1E0Z3_9RHOB|nr:DUF2254 domain-containing protein [Pseudorhodobacter turbinis]QCO56334.1 DUF2254 domain-containing protein [Pseudorhodobacter turbinis]
MISKWRLFIRELLQKLWVVTVLYAILAVVTNLGAIVIGPLLPSGLGASLGSGAVESVLTILASSMLAVVTFSLGIMVSAFAGAASAVTPRATTLLKADRTTHRVLATFLGSFLYSLIGIIALNGGVLTDNDRLVLFVVSIVVVLIVVIAILRWIAHLTVFGQMDDSIDKVEAAARRALSARLRAPYLGGHGHPGPPPPDAYPIYPNDIGYVRYVHMDWLQDRAEDLNCQVYLTALPGAFVHPGIAVAYILGERPKDDDKIIDAFTIGETRSFEQDPRFGLSVLAEIAERALSPAVNDPGTAIDILGRTVRLLAPLAEDQEPELSYPHIWVPALTLEDMMEDIFPPIARDGAAIFAVQMRLQKALLALAQIAPARFGKTALVQAERAQSRSHDKMMPHEQTALEAVVARIAKLAPTTS